MAFGLSGSLSACFMYIFALLCVSIEWQIKMLACLLACLCQISHASVQLVTPAGPRLRNDLWCVEWDVKL